MSQVLFEQDCGKEDIICYKHIPNIETVAITSLQESLKTISVLKIEFCNLTGCQVEILANLLIDNHSVTEVSLNGNPNKAQNFYLLLRKTNILFLSLKFCSIDCKGIEKISDELCTPYENHLLHLNLSSNSLYNEGVEHIVRFLRINRTLISLNLADNKIYDWGCLQLMAPLRKFSLNFEEIVTRRRMKFEIAKRHLNSNVDTGTQTTETLNNEKTSRNKKRTSKGSSSRSLEITSNRDSKINSVEFDIVNHHPFMYASEETDNIYCLGNDVLINLNLSYNRITWRGLNFIIEMVDYQINNYAYDKGISRISVEGNVLNDWDKDKLNELLIIKSKRSSIGSKRSYLSLRKRS